MRRKAWPVGFGLVLLGIGAFAILVPPPKPSPFEVGFGLRLVGERSARAGMVTRFYASREGFGPLVRRIDRQISASGSIMEDMRMWGAKEGLVTASRRPLDTPDEGWPAGTQVYVTTLAPRPPSLLQRIGRCLGIKPLESVTYF